MIERAYPIEEDLPSGSIPPSRALAISSAIAAEIELAEVIGLLADEQYTQSPVGTITSSIGAHVRHCLDHVDTLLAGVATGRIEYDRRHRGTEVEWSRHAALSVIDRHVSALRCLEERSLLEPLTVTTRLTPNAEPITLSTSLGRELAFVISHTVHHGAMIRAMIESLGRTVPVTFGYAPATIHHREQQCVR